MGLFSDLKVVWHLVIRPRSGHVHSDWLNRFYQTQADDYDSFRKRFLKGREELWNSIPIPKDGIWVDMGGGTGSNMAGFRDNLKELQKVYIVDLAKPLLDIADQRIQKAGWTNVETVEADATKWVPPDGQADVVTFSYSLTMIPDWFKAIDQAYRILKPGGTIGVVDFFLSRKFPYPNQKRHSFATRNFWPAWFSCDNIFLTPDHYPYLNYRFKMESFTEKRLTVPYFPAFWWKMPYYIYVGKKTENGEAGEPGIQS